MKEELKKTYRGFLGWLRYVKDYKDNLDNDLISEHRLIEANKKITRIKKKYDDLLLIQKANEELLSKREIRFQELNNKYGQLQRELKDKNTIIVDQIQYIDELRLKLEKTEYARRKNAGAIGGLKTKIKELEEKLNKANYTIEYYRKNRKQPNVEEIKAYEYSRKEVEKRIKNK